MSPSFTVQVFQAGPETERTLGTAMEGVPVSEPRQIEWLSHRNAPATISVRLGDWANGIYFARLTAPDGQNYYAPLIVRPHPFGAHRVAVVLETNTWQAYNHYDTDGDGWGNTWYAANDIRTVDLVRPYIQGGAPPHWRYWAVPFLHWLYRTGKQVDFLSDDDLEHFRSAKALARLYDLIIFPGHEEYVTTHEYNLISGYRNLGGNLMFLASCNFLWKIDLRGNLISRIAQWRTLGRPESRLIGVQYRANDEGQHRGSYELTPYGQRSWQFAGVDQAALDKWPWFGVEFDMTAPLLAPRHPHPRTGQPAFPQPQSPRADDLLPMARSQGLRRRHHGLHRRSQVSAALAAAGEPLAAYGRAIAPLSPGGFSLRGRPDPQCVDDDPAAELIVESLRPR